MAVRKTHSIDNLTEVDLEKHFVISDGLAHLPPGTLCGPLQEPTITTNWGILEVCLTGTGPFDLPQLIVASNSQDQQNIALPLKFLRTLQDGSVVFGTPVSRERLKRTLFLIPSLRSCAIETITTRVIPISGRYAAWKLAQGLLKSPALALRSVAKHNLGYRFEDWPRRPNLKEMARVVLDVASRNFPNPDSLYFGFDPSYSFWTNDKYETLIPRKMITREHKSCPLQVAVILDEETDPDSLVLTLNSLLAAGMQREMISLIQNGAILSKLHGFALTHETDFLGSIALPEDDRFLIVLKSGDCISRDFLNLCNSIDDSQVSCAYFDHDLLVSNGTYARSEFKPDCSPATLLFRNYPSRAVIVRASLINELLKKIPRLASAGLAGVIYGASIEAALTKEQAVAHLSIPAIHLSEVSAGRISEQFADEKQARDLLMRKYAPNLFIESSDIGGAAWYAKKPVFRKITIVIPTKNQVVLLKTAIDSIQALTDYPNYEILVIDNLSDQLATTSYLDTLAQQGAVTVMPFDEVFNFAKMHNQVIPKLSTDYVLMLNNDTEILDPSWLTHLIDLFELPNTGIVGNKLLYPDGTIQHIGAVGGLKGPMSHSLSGHKDIPGHPLLSFPRNVLGVTGACLLIPQQLYVDCGGMDEKLAVSYNDMDLCLSVRVTLHRSILVSSSGGVIHKESKSRGTSFSPELQKLLNTEAEYFDNKWLRYIRPDPYYNINLSLEKDYALL